MKSMNNATITLMSSNLDKSIAFYSEILGLKLIKNYSGYYAEMDAKGLKIGLHPTDIKIKNSGSMSLGFGVSNYNMEVEWLNSKGIEGIESQDGPIKIFQFTDIDGNQLYLTEIKD